MDPTTLGIAAAALIAAKGAEGFATEAGKRLWGIVAKLYDAVSERLTGRGEQEALERTARRDDDSHQSETALALAIERHATDSQTFRRLIEGLVGQAQSDQEAARIIAQAFDNAKQINIAGDNSGPITM